MGDYRFLDGMVPWRMASGPLFTFFVCFCFFLLTSHANDCVDYLNSVVTIPVDSLLWGRITYPEFEVALFNVIYNKSHEYGVSLSAFKIELKLIRSKIEYSFSALNTKYLPYRLVLGRKKRRKRLFRRVLTVLFKLGALKKKLATWDRYRSIR